MNPVAILTATHLTRDRLTGARVDDPVKPDRPSRRRRAPHAV